MKMSLNKRLLVSLGAGVFILLLAIAGSFVGAALAYKWHIEWFGKPFIFLIGWPFAVLKPITPNSEDASTEAVNLRTAILIAVPLIDVLTYSLLTYIALWWRDSRKHLL